MPEVVGRLCPTACPRAYLAPGARSGFDQWRSKSAHIPAVYALMTATGFDIPTALLCRTCIPLARGQDGAVWSGSGRRGSGGKCGSRNDRRFTYAVQGSGAPSAPSACWAASSRILRRIG